MPALRVEIPQVKAVMLMNDVKVKVGLQFGFAFADRINIWVVHH